MQSRRDSPLNSREFDAAVGCAHGGDVRGWPDVPPLGHLEARCLCLTVRRRTPLPRFGGSASTPHLCGGMRPVDLPAPLLRPFGSAAAVARPGVRSRLPPRSAAPFRQVRVRPPSLRFGGPVRQQVCCLGQRRAARSFRKPQRRSQFRGCSTLHAVNTIDGRNRGSDRVLSERFCRPAFTRLDDPNGDGPGARRGRRLTSARPRQRSLAPARPARSQPATSQSRCVSGATSRRSLTGGWSEAPSFATDSFGRCARLP